MMKSIKTHDLKVGMIIHIPMPWYRHPFFRSTFRITSTEQIRKLIKNGVHYVELKEINEDTQPVKVHVDVPKKEMGRIEENGSKELDQAIISEFKDVIADKNLAAQKKAKLVYKASIMLMEGLLKSPTTKNIKDFKDVTCNIVDLILSDNETSKFLLGITAHDFYTYTHSVNVGVLSILLAKSLFAKSDNHNMHELGAGFFLHDIGKTRVDSSLLNKKGKFTEQEMVQMRVHPKEGYNILAETDQLSEEIKIIVMQHHEREDGTGYPDKRKGKEIHPYGCICSIVDVYDALTSRRPYKKSFSSYNALKIMREEMATHFQPELFKEFIMFYQK